MFEKMNYEAPEMLLVNFDSTDVITSSVDDGKDPYVNDGDWD